MKLTPNSVMTSHNMKMPVVGLGTWQSTDQEIEQAIDTALEIGYRHIDTAFLYMNEAAIGRALKKWFSNGKIKREEVFIVTKLPNFANRADDVEPFIKKSLEALQLEYVDLYLVHNPIGLKRKEGEFFPRNEKGELDLDMETNHATLWKAMEKQVIEGRAKAIGVSNFNIRQIDNLLKICDIPPANNQVEMHVYLQQKELLEFCKKRNVTVCAYAPLGSPGLVPFVKQRGFSANEISNLSPMTDPTVIEIAKKYGKTTSQVLLRFLIQVGVAVIPKSTNPERIKWNFQIFDFELGDDEMEKLKALDKGKAGRMFGNNGVFKGVEKHPEYPFEI